MPVMERSAVVPLPLEETWEAIFGDQMQNWVRLSDAVVEVRDYRMRADGTPEYVMVNRAGPMKMSHRSDYVAYDPPHQAVDDALESALGGRWVSVHEPVEGGTRVTHRWDVKPHGVMKILFPLMRKLMAGAFQQDLELMVERIRQTHERPSAA